MTVTAWDELVLMDPRRPRPPPTPRIDPHEPPWARNARWGIVDGVEIEVFSIDALAAALERSPQTVRRWESDGTLPHCDLWRESHDRRGRRRRYERAWIEGLAEIAADEGLLERRSGALDATQFSRRAFALRRRLRAD